MMEFWITFGIFGLIWAPLMIIFLVGGVDLKHTLGGTIVVLIFWFICAGSCYLDEMGKQEAWNGGYCDCGTHWELKGASKSRTGHTTKYYQCPNCYAEIQK